MGIFRIKAEADPHRSGLEGVGTFVGQRGTVEPCPDCNSQFSQSIRELLAVPLRQEGKGASLMGAGEDPKAPFLQTGGTGLHLPMLR